jgi:hypothetical protein
MFIRTWLFIAALGITLATSGQVWGQPTGENGPKDEASTATSDNAADAEQEDAESLSTALNSIESAIRDLIADEDQVAQDAQDSKERRDLQAQEGMALWAMLMFFAAAATVLLTYLALRAIVKTLDQTKRAADYTKDMLEEAERATKAAMDGVAATRDIGEKQVRAYLHVKTVSFCIGKNEGEVGATISVANAGQSPAIGVKVTIVFENDGKEPAILKIPMPNIAANSEQSRTVKPIKGDSTGIGLMNAKRVTTYVNVEAMDVFDKRIEAVSMRTIYIPSGARDGENFTPEDAEGYFPDAAVKFLAERHGRFGPNKEKSSKA